MKHNLLLASSGLVTVLFFIFIKPIPQDPFYHLFADTRRFLGFENAVNVFTNIPFTIIGSMGILRLWPHLKFFRDTSCVIPYFIFFAGILLTGFGSGYYHLLPDNQRLVWDRLPMTIAFMSFFSAVILETVNRKAGIRLLLPLITTGLFSVWFWHFTEQRGAGDLRPYILVQFLPMLLIPAILFLYKSEKNYRRNIFFILLLYTIAKVFENLDSQIYTHLNALSGHSIKHLVAALATYGVYRMVAQKTPISDSRKKVAPNSP